MAGSYGHVVDDDGRLINNQDLNDMLEHGGDVYEAVEEMYGMIHWLATRLSDATGLPRRNLVAEAVQRYKDGLAIGRGHPERESDS